MARHAPPDPVRALRPFRFRGRGKRHEGRDAEGRYPGHSLHLDARRDVQGAYFLEHDLPAAEAERDTLLLAVMGSPDPRQIDGIGGADPLTSKVAVVAASERPDADVEYLFLQVFVDQAVVTDRQNCGNILAGVAQFAVEKGLVRARGSAAPRSPSTWSTAIRSPG